MSLTDRILPRYILSRVRVSVRPSNFLYAKNFQIIGKLGWLTRVVYFNDPATGYEWGAPMNASRAGGHGWATMNSDIMCGGRRRRRRLCVCTCVRACVRVCARACMHACVCACVMCLQYTIQYLTQADNYYPIFHTNQTL